MGLSWQQGPLGRGPVGRFLIADPPPQPLLYAEPLRRRMRVRFSGRWIADSEKVLLLHEPGHYPVAFFPLADVDAEALVKEERITQHHELRDTRWFSVKSAEQTVARSAWQYIKVPDYAAELRDRVAFAWRAMDGFYEEDERIVGRSLPPNRHPTELATSCRSGWRNHHRRHGPASRAV